MVKEERLDLLFRLASKLDKDTFFEVSEIISKYDAFKSYRNDRKSLFSMLDIYRRSLNDPSELFQYFGIAKTTYSSWKKVDKVPNKYVEKVSVLLGISNDEAILRNSK